MLPSKTHSRLLDDLRRAAGHHQAGRIDRAEALYQRVMRKMPTLAAPPYLLGSIAFDRGRHAYALQLADDSIRAQPDFAPAHLLRGNALAALGRHAEAEIAWKRVVALAPEDPAAHVNLALRLCEKGDPDAALAHAKQALALDPRLFRAHYAAGLAMRQLNNPSDAASAFAESLRLAPDNTEVMRAHGEVLAVQGRTEEAIATLARALERAPHDPELRRQHAQALLDHGDLKLAEATLRSLIASLPSPDSWCALGEMLRTTGRFEEAAQAYREALAIEPSSASALAGLANTKSPLLPGELAALESAAGNTEQPITTRASLLHALGRRHESDNLCDPAFARHAEADSLVRTKAISQGKGFDAVLFAAEVDAFINNWTAPEITRLAAASPQDPRPVFIVGLPRSGSTLVEQIIASHPDVRVTGERLDIPMLAARLEALGPPSALDAAVTSAMATEYLETLSKLADGKSRVVDKQLNNIFYLGVIGALLPGARVLLCLRDLRDVGLSCFFQEFAGYQNEFLDLEDIGRRCLQTQRIAQHWLEHPPVPLLPVHYEHVVNDLEGQARAIIDFLGLPWSPACLDFHRTQRRVITNSAWQVRQPLYNRSIGRWRQYASHLEPLLKVLDSETC